MKPKRIALLILSAALAACVAVAPSPTSGPGKSKGHGPPPHAPAHGYRAKTPQGVELSFDSGIGVYVVVAAPGQYWLDDRYYRKAASDWQIRVDSRGTWTAVAVIELPIGLQRLDGSPGKGKSKKGKGAN